MTVVFMFPGQSSRYPGMLHKLMEMGDENRALVKEASDVVGRDLAAHYHADNAGAYAKNRDVQIGVFLANHLFLQLLQGEGVQAQASLGLSLGEWNHLVHIGALPFAEALSAVERRGEAYDAGPRGMMASIFPIDLEELDDVVGRASEAGLLEVVNLNSPRQHVLAGETAAVQKALQILEDDFYLEGTIIERHVPMHSSLFAPVGEAFRQALETLSFRQPRLRYLPNRLGQFVEEPDKATFVELLSTHVHMPVLWRRSIDLVLATWPQAALVEVGPKAVLYNLLDRKWHKAVNKLRTDSAEDTATHLEQTVDALRATQRGAPAIRHAV